MTQVPDFDDLPEVKGMPKGMGHLKVVAGTGAILKSSKDVLGVYSTRMERRTFSELSTTSHLKS